MAETDRKFLVTGELAQLQINAEEQERVYHKEVEQKLAERLGETESRVLAFSNGFYSGFVAKDGEEPPPGLVIAKRTSARGDKVFVVGGRALKAKREWQRFFDNCSNGYRVAIKEAKRTFWDASGVSPEHLLIPGFIVYPVVFVLSRETGVVLLSVPDATEVPEHKDLKPIKNWECQKLIDEENERRAAKKTA